MCSDGGADADARLESPARVKLVGGVLIKKVEV